MQKPTLKRIHDFVPSDFDASPVWVCAYVFDHDEPWHGEVDEVTYRPWEGSLPFTDRPWFVYALGRAQFRLADGDTLDGYSAPPGPPSGLVADELSSMQPVLFLPDNRHCPFWLGRRAAAEEVRGLYDALGKRAADVFPIECSFDPRLFGDRFALSIPGICSLTADFKGVTVQR
jgi:hypothetical protein